MAVYNLPLSGRGGERIIDARVHAEKDSLDVYIVCALLLPCCAVDVVQHIWTLGYIFGKYSL